MPKIERLSWLVPLSDGRGITLSNDPAADQFLAEDANALLIGVLLDSQYPTRIAFASPLKLRDRLGHLDMAQIAVMEAELLQRTFADKPALHRFPRKFAGLTQQLAATLVADYQGNGALIWQRAQDCDELSRRLLALPAFGVAKVNWTVGMLGTLGMLHYDGWDGFEVAPSPKRRKSSTTDAAE